MASFVWIADRLVPGGEVSVAVADGAVVGMMAVAPYAALLRPDADG